MCLNTVITCKDYDPNEQQTHYDVLFIVKAVSFTKLSTPFPQKSGIDAQRHNMIINQYYFSVPAIN